MDRDGTYLCRIRVGVVYLSTQFTYEKKWTKTSEQEALNIIEKEMPETDVAATWRYILSEIEKGKTVTLGDCRFRRLSE